MHGIRSGVYLFIQRDRIIIPLVRRWALDVHSYDVSIPESEIIGNQRILPSRRVFSMENKNHGFREAERRFAKLAVSYLLLLVVATKY